MRRIYVSTVGRGKQKEESSKIYCLDYDTGKTIAEVKLPLSMLDLGNPRGGCRGARGLAWRKGEVVAAGFDGLFQLDPEDLFVRNGNWFRNMRDIHQIYLNEDGDLDIVATFTNEVCNLTYRMDYSDIHPGEPAPDWFPGCKDTLHLNSISENYGLCSKAAIIIDRKNRKVAFESEEYLKGSHDIWELPTGEVVINNSKQCRTVAFNPETWEVTRILYQETETEGGSELAKRGWTRGMFYMPQNDMMLIGSSPAEVIVLKNISGNTSIQKRIKISDEIVEATFDVLPHPEDWK